MRPIRVIALVLVTYNLAAVTALLVLSSGQVYALAIMAGVLLTTVVAC